MPQKAYRVLKLWDERVELVEEQAPAIAVYSVQNATGSAVVICPGGGYVSLQMEKEGHKLARWFAQRGVTPVVLTYRHAPHRHPVPSNDVRRALRWVRANAAELDVDENRVGVMGFSAGGHAAGTVAVHFDAGNPTSPDPIERQSCRPEFAILIYPVITMGQPLTHGGSRSNLLGPDAPPELVDQLSLEKHVTASTPPTFLFHTTPDPSVPVEHTLMFYQALRRAGVPAEMHVFAHGHHGVGMAEDMPGLSQWPALLEAWMQRQGYLSRDQK